MKRLLLLIAAGAILVIGQLLINCSKPLDTDTDFGPLDPSPPRIDTIFNTDTLFLTDTIIGADTIIITDTIVGIDTIIVVDTIVGGDTIIVTDTLIQADTIIETDTVIVADTIIQTDTLTQTDTIIQTDTVTQTDTLTYADTVVVADTVFVPTGYCASLSASQHEILWMFQNDAGSYLLEFVAMPGDSKPPKNLIIDVGGQQFEWHPNESMVFEIEQNLGEYTYARIWSDSPRALGHAVAICLKITGM